MYNIFWNFVVIIINTFYVKYVYSNVIDKSKMNIIKFPKSQLSA